MSEPVNGPAGPSEEPVSPGDQSELDLGVMATGNATVDEALGALDQLGGLAVADHPAVFEQVHQGLTEAMSAASVDPDDPAERSTDHER